MRLTKRGEAVLSCHNPPDTFKCHVIRSIIHYILYVFGTELILQRFVWDLSEALLSDITQSIDYCTLYNRLLRSIGPVPTTSSIFCFSPCWFFRKNCDSYLVLSNGVFIAYIIGWRRESKYLGVCSGIWNSASHHHRKNEGGGSRELFRKKLMSSVP